MSKKARPAISNNLIRLARTLFEVDSERYNKFIECFKDANASASALIWVGERVELGLTFKQPLAWQAEFVSRLEAGQSPGKLSQHEAGLYYLLDFSSVFMAAPLNLVGAKDITRILDLCAAPGGKSIFAAKLFSPKELVCNEVIGKRTAQLHSNLRRCHIQNCSVVSQDSKILAEKYSNYFDLVIVDAPCSAQSLLTRGERASSCFHSATINLNSNRQKRIIANAAKMVKSGGYLAYMTCTYSLKENEGVLEWLLEKFPEYTAIELAELCEFRSEYSEVPCYRLWPWQGIGGGGFTALLTNNKC